MTADRCVIVNADDFGLTPGINRGIIEARERGILTSASLMVHAPAAEKAAAYAREHPTFGIGLHFDAGEWRFTAGEWVQVYHVVDSADAVALHAELQRQLEAFGQLLRRGPTHLDSHQHMHLSEPARSVFLNVAQQLDVRLRSCDSAISYCGSFYGQTGEGEPYADGITIEHLVAIIEQAPAGWTEIGTHPGYADGLNSVYALEREQELRVLCSTAVREAVKREGVKLCSFGDFGR